MAKSSEKARKRPIPKPSKSSKSRRSKSRKAVPLRSKAGKASDLAATIAGLRGAITKLHARSLRASFADDDGGDVEAQVHKMVFDFLDNYFEPSFFNDLTKVSDFPLTTTQLFDLADLFNRTAATTAGWANASVMRGTFADKFAGSDSTVADLVAYFYQAIEAA